MIILIIEDVQTWHSYSSPQSGGKASGALWAARRRQVASRCYESATTNLTGAITMPGTLINAYFISKL